MMKSAGRGVGGQSLLEYGFLVAAIATAMIIMSGYVRRAFNAHAAAIEKELQGRPVPQ